MKTLITQQNVSKKIEQFNAGHLINGRAPIIKKGWADIKIEETFFDLSIDKIVELIGGRATTMQTVRFRLRNEPLHAWFSERFIYSVERKTWTYCAGQDYTAEIREIRKYLTK